MKRKSFVKRIWMLSLALIMTVASVTAAIAAGSGTVELLLKYQDVTLSLYKVGNYSAANGQREVELTEAFKNSGVDLSTIWTDASAFRTVSEKLQTYARQNNPAVYQSLEILPYSEDGTSLKGRAVAEQVEDGIYLIIKTGGDTHIDVSPFIVTLPYLDEDSQTWNYQVKVYPKCEYTPDRGGGGGDGDGGGGSRGGGGGTSTVEITDQEVPLTSWIPDEPVPLAALPKMGDLGIAGYLLGAFAAVTAGAASFLRRRKCREDEA